MNASVKVTSSENSGKTILSLSEDDYYYEGEYLVFTAAYHLKRGYCCGSGCRHCPYRGANAGEKQDADPSASPQDDND